MAMETVTIEQIEEQLRKLPSEKLPAVLDFVSYLIEREHGAEIIGMVFASEPILSRDWDIPEENSAWADL